MKRHGFVRIPLRRETLATRRLRARIARERQGPDGKWETNQKKREVRTVKRKCRKLDSVFEDACKKRFADQVAAIEEAKTLSTALNEIETFNKLQGLVSRLEKLAVSPALLRQSPSILDALVSAAKRCRKSKDPRVSHLVGMWETMKREGKTRHRLSRKRAPPVDDISAISEPRVLGTGVSQTMQPPRFVTPCRPVKSSPTMKLGRLFSQMRAKHAAEESEALEVAKKLKGDLASCDNASTLRNLIPHLEALLVTPRMLNESHESPSILQALVAAAKRCRKSKDASVVRLLSSWREKQSHKLFEPQNLKHECTEIVAIPTSTNFEPSGPTQGQGKIELLASPDALMHAPALKQCRMTAFLAKPVTTAGAGAGA